MKINLKELPVAVGPMFEGERIRGPDMYIELGGPKIDKKAELVMIHTEPDRVTDGKITVLGKDIPQFEEGAQTTFGIKIEMYGKRLEPDLEAVFERKIHDFFNYIQGVMHLNQRYDIWCRVSKDAVKSGLNFIVLGKAVMMLYTMEYGEDLIERIQITFMTDAKDVENFRKTAMQKYKERDEKTKGMKDEEVDVFYSCSLCQSFAPNHVCAVTPERISLCGALSWVDCKAAARLDPEGPNQPIKKGTLLDASKGEYSGINEFVDDASHGATKHVYLYSAFNYPHTSCGCFESVLYYIPEVNGFGLVDRNFNGAGVNGLKFSQMAVQTGGGMQTEGFLGMGILWMTSRKFISGDAVEGYECDEKYSKGWSRMVWMPSYLKQGYLEYIPQELRDRIATEKDAADIDGLKTFLIEKKHPVVKTFEKEEEREVQGNIGGAEAEEDGAERSTTTIPVRYGGQTYKIILKNAKIYADSLIIQKIEKPKGGK